MSMPRRPVTVAAAAPLAVANWLRCQQLALSFQGPVDPSANILGHTPSLALMAHEYETNSEHIIMERHPTNDQPP